VEPFVPELFEDDPMSKAAAKAGTGVLPSSLAHAATTHVESVLEAATLTRPEPPRWRSRGGRNGVHSRSMGYLLAEMQHLARSHPGATW
jgi:ring-1,2-phenylacetyl-CoA epoxidase subunit PaaC